MSEQVWLAWIGLAAGIFGPIALAIAGWIKMQATAKRVDEVHTIVNQQRSDMMAEIASLRSRIAIAEETARNLAQKAGPPMTGG